MSDVAYRLVSDIMVPYLSQLDSLQYCHARETESTWDNNSDLVDTDATTDHMLYGAAETRW